MFCEKCTTRQAICHRHIKDCDVALCGKCLNEVMKMEGNEMPSGWRPKGEIMDELCEVKITKWDGRKLYGIPDFIRYEIEVDPFCDTPYPVDEDYAKSLVGKTLICEWQPYVLILSSISIKGE